MASGALRIVGGALGGRRFGRPASTTRPTSDRVREAIASIVGARVELEGARVLELFAGTGACSFELLSRGAAGAVVVERDAEACADIRASMQALGVAERTRLLRLDLTTSKGRDSIPSGPFDVVLVDPPYVLAQEGLGLIALVAQSGRLAPGALAVLEHRTADTDAIDRALRATSSPLEVVSRYRYGDTSIVLFSALDGAAPGET
jgi:16S rRNA (guanine966-N2)-methyltransferase